MSPEGSSQLYPVGAVLSATGLTTIAFKLESPQVAALVLKKRKTVDTFTMIAVDSAIWKEKKIKLMKTREDTI